MNAVAHATRLGISRGWIEFKQYLRSPQEMTWAIVMSAIFIGVLWFQRDKTIEGASLALLTLPSLLGMTIAQGGFMGAASVLSLDREDGTLLRAKATPQGMVGYLVARILYVTLTIIVSLVMLVIPSLFLVDGLMDISGEGFFALFWVFVLGLLATAPWGAIVGSLVKSSSSGFGLTFLPLIGLISISGIFYPITAIAGWLQVVAQAFPIYWMGLGMRSAFLPDSAAAAELTGSWRTGETVVVLVIWAVIGMLIAPRILRRMAQRESGSAMEQRKHQAIQRGY